MVVFIPNSNQKNPGYFRTITVSTAGKSEVVVGRVGRYCMRDFSFTFPRHRTYLFTDKKTGSAYTSAETTYLFNFTVSCVGYRRAILGTATRLRPGRSGVWIPLGERDFSLLPKVQNGCRAYLMGTENSCPLGKAAKPRDWSLNPVEVPSLKMNRTIRPPPFYAFVAFTGTSLYIRVLVVRKKRVCAFSCNGSLEGCVLGCDTI